MKEYQSKKIVHAVELKHVKSTTEFKLGDNLKDKEFTLTTVFNEEIIVNLHYLSKKMYLSFDELQHLTYQPEGIPVGGYFVQYDNEFVSWSPKEPFEKGNTEIKPYYNIGVKSLEQDEYDDGIQELRLELNDGRIFNQRRIWPGSKAGGVIEAYYQLSDMGIENNTLVRLVCKMSDYLDGDDFEKILFAESKK